MDVVDKTAYRGIWVFVEQRNGICESVSLELCSEGRRIADSCGERLVAVVIGSDTASAADAAADTGVDEVIRVDGGEYADYTTDP
ncbi:MAG: hypothetical protein LBQ56_06185, partial [Synergistaceae bacterium]|nr:hypothetical protein [Synergistaceae bacterium]